MNKKMLTYFSIIGVCSLLILNLSVESNARGILSSEKPNLINEESELSISDSSTKSPLKNMGNRYQMPKASVDNGKYILPVPSSGSITAYFSEIRYDGIRAHKGMDIGAEYGEDIVASRAGKVIKTNDNCPTTGYYGNRCGDEFGNYVFLEHEDGMITIYPHMSLGSLEVKVGDEVFQGQKLGEIGSSGSSTGPHLHFEMRKDGKIQVDPLDYLTQLN